MNTVTLKVPAISCGHCVNTIEMEIGEIEGVLQVTADAETKSVLVTYQEPASEQAVRDALTAINYPALEG